MKKYPIILTSLLLIGLTVWLLFSRSSPADTLAEPAAVSKPPPASKTNSSAQATALAKQTKADDEENDALEAAYDAKRERERQEDEARARREYNTPIVFYGLVLDQFDQPVSTARVEYDSVGGSFEGDREVVADTQGRFTITGIRGKRLRIRVTHDRYYNDNYASSYFVYAGNDRGPDFKPNPAKPEIFHLRKKGEAAELIRQSDQILFNPDEKERSFSLYDHSRRRDQPDYVIIRFVDKGRINSRGKHVLDLELSTPGGGIQPRTDPFQFTAPTTGYQSSLIPPPDVGVNIKDYFVRFDSGNYGRFTISGNSGQYDVESYLNPDQSPNLEYDKDKEITFVRTGRMGIDLLYPASDDPNKPLPKSTPAKPVERPGGSLIERRRNAAPPPAPPRG